MKISRKLSLGTLVSLFTVTIMVLFLHYRIMIGEANQQLLTLADAVAPIIEEGIADSMLTRDARSLHRTLRNTENIQPISKVLLLNTKGVVKAATEARMIGTRLFQPGAGPAARSGGNWISSGPAGERSYRSIRPVRNRRECYGCHDPRTGNNGFIVVDLSTREIDNNTKRHLRKELALFSGPIFLVGFILFWLTNAVVIKRLQGVVNAVRRFKAGDYSVRIVPGGKDEISRLGEDFNELAASIDSSRRELEQYAGELLALAVSSQVVSAIPRTENMYEAICNIAVKELKLKMTWIGLVKQGSFDVFPAAQCGFEEDYLSGVRVRWDDSPEGGGPTGMAIKNKTPRIVNDLESDAAYAPWREEARKRGYRSSMALPLLSSDGELLAVLNFYSGELAYFTPKRTRAFMIFANQTATALENRGLIEKAEKNNAELAEQFKLISHSQKEWQMTFDSITDLVSIHDREFRILRANKAFLRYCGVSPQELVHKKCHDVFHGTCSPVVNCPHVTSMDEKRVFTEEVRDPKTGKLFRVSTYPYYAPEGEFIGSVHIARDISEEKTTEMRLIMSERLASLGQMASGLAHEINTPLASIAGCAEGLLMKVRNNRFDPKLFEEYLLIVAEEIQRCKSITTGMLSFVRTATYEKKDIMINEALDKALEIISFQGRLTDVTIARNYAADLPPVHGSDGELRQILLVIISNALDAMENSGSLALGTGVEEDRVLIKIADSGPGIAPDHLTRIFDPFFTTKSDKGGTGLGLSIAHKIVSNHGGTLDVASQEGKGATFTITLPLL